MTGEDNSDEDLGQTGDSSLLSPHRSSVEWEDLVINLTATPLSPPEFGLNQNMPRDIKQIVVC